MTGRHLFSICFISASLIVSLTEAQSDPRTTLKGEDFRINFSFKVPAGSRKYLCRDDCTDQDILVQTWGHRFRSGRHTIRYDHVKKKIYVVITELTKADAGRYKVGVSTSTSLGSFEEFYIEVGDICDGGITGEPRVYHATEGGNITIGCFLPLHEQRRKFLCRDECHKLLLDTNSQSVSSNKYTLKYSGGFLQVTITQLTSSDSGRYRCGVGGWSGGHTCREFEITFQSTEGSGHIVVGVIAVAVNLTGFLLLACKWKMGREVQNVSTRASGRDMETTSYDDCAAASHPPSSSYQELDPHSREDNLYASLHR